jgi:hypothetical protein
MAGYYQIDEATLKLIDTLLEANVLQLIMIAPILVVVGQMLANALAFWRDRQNRRNTAKQEQSAQTADDLIIIRLLDLSERQIEANEKGNDNTAALTAAIVALDRNIQVSEKERLTIHTANRENILEGNRALTLLAQSVDKMHSNITGNMQQMALAMNGFRAQIAALIESVDELKRQDEQRVQHIEQIIREALKGARVTSNDLKPILDTIEKWRTVEAKEHAMLMQKIIELHPTPPDDTEPDDQIPTQKIKPLNADAGAAGAPKLPKTGTEG